MSTEFQSQHWIWNREIEFDLELVSFVEHVNLSIQIGLQELR